MERSSPRENISRVARWPLSIPDPLGTLIELVQGRVDRAPAGRPRRQVLELLAAEQDRFARERAHPIEIGLGEFVRRACGNVSGIGHGKEDRVTPRSPWLIQNADGERM